MPASALLNGEPASDLAFGDRACHFGDGLFETLVVRDGRPCLWDRHWDRLVTGCERLGIPVPPPGRIAEEAAMLCAGHERAVLKIIVTAGRAGTGYGRDPKATPNRWLRITPWPERHPWNSDRPLRVQVCRLRLASQPRLAGIKHLNRLEQVLARQELSDGIDEGLLCDHRGRVVEAISANLLVRIAGRWITPPIVDCGVAGTVRRLLLEHGSRAGIQVTEAPLDLQSLGRAEAVFLTNALLGIRPVGDIDGQRLPRQGRDQCLERLHRACFTLSGEIGCND